MPTWNLLADHYSKIPHSEHVTIAKVGEGLRQVVQNAVIGASRDIVMPGNIIVMT